MTWLATAPPCDRHPHGPRLRCRADATAERLGPEHDKALLALSRCGPQSLQRDEHISKHVLLSQELYCLVTRDLHPEMPQSRKVKAVDCNSIYNKHQIASNSIKKYSLKQLLKKYLDGLRLADVLEARGAPTEAEPLRRRLLEARERLWGPRALRDAPSGEQFGGGAAKSGEVQRGAADVLCCSHRGGWMVLHFVLGKVGKIAGKQQPHFQIISKFCHLCRSAMMHEQ